MNNAISSLRIGFFPCFFSIGETLPHIKIAKILQKMGHDIIFFSHGGKFEHLVHPFRLKKLSSLSWEEAKESMKNDSIDPFNKKSMERILFYPYLTGNNEKYVREEMQAFIDEEIDILICSFNPTVRISTSAANIPLFMLQSGTFIVPFIKQGKISFPENYESLVTKIIPSSIKNYLIKWFLLHNKLLVKDFNKINKKFDLPRFKTLHDIMKGDYNLVCDDINLLGIQPSKEYPNDCFIGPIFGGLNENETALENDILDHFNKNKKTIFITLGSSLDDDFNRAIFDTLYKTEYQVVFLDPFFEKRNIPPKNHNILIKSFIDSPRKLHTLADLSIIHGGRGTVYTAAFSGKPVIGYPHYLEHQYNIDNLVQKGAAIRLSKRYFDSNELLESINHILNNYSIYLKNAKELSEQLPQKSGEEKAAKVIMNICNKKL